MHKSFHCDRQQQAPNKKKIKKESTALCLSFAFVTFNYFRMCYCLGILSNLSVNYCWWFFLNCFERLSSSRLTNNLLSGILFSETNCLVILIVTSLKCIDSRHTTTLFDSQPVCWLRACRCLHCGTEHYWYVVNDLWRISLYTQTRSSCCRMCACAIANSLA